MNLHYQKSSNVFGITGTQEEVIETLRAVYKVGLNLKEVDLMKMLTPTSRKKWHELIEKIGKIIVE